MISVDFVLICCSVIHRADYHGVLLDEATRLGAKVKLNAEVVDITAAESPCVTLHSGEVVSADVIVGADGMYVIDTIHLGSVDVD
jgi:salicylate hydroxylase